MTIEQKAAAYDEAIERAKDFMNGEVHYELKIGENIMCWVFPELRESEDEKIRKEIIELVKFYYGSSLARKQTVSKDEMVAWLEKQGDTNETINRDKFAQGVLRGAQPRYSIGDVLCDKSCTTLDKNAQPNFEITDIRDGMYICDKCSFPISQQDEYELVAKKIEPKFKVGDWVVYECGEETATLQITRIVVETYVFSDDSTLDVVDEDTLRLWDITKDAKDGKVLYTKGGIGHEKKDIVFIFKGIGSRDYLDEPCIEHYCYLCEDRFYVNTTGFMGVLSDNIKQGTCPATKEQRDLLLQKMKEAGYEWDSEKKELKKIEQKPAMGAKGNEREIPFSEQEWSEEDEAKRNALIGLVEEIKNQPLRRLENWDEYISWLKSLKDRYTWKPSEEQIASITCAVRKMKESACYDSELVSLFNDLKKLKG